MIHLKIIDKDGYTFYGSADKQEFFFGKKKTNDIVSKMRFIAQEQLRFLKQPKFWTVENLNDSDKTTVSLNGKQLCAGTVRRLSSGDVIMIFQNDDKENSLFIDGYEVLLKKENLGEKFTLKGKPYAIAFDRIDDEMARVDIEDVEGSVPKVFKMSQADQRFMKQEFFKYTPEQKIRVSKERILKLLDRMDMIDAEELQNYVDLIVSQMDRETLAALEKSPQGFAVRIKKYIEGLLDIHYERQFREWIETGEIVCRPSYQFPMMIAPIRATTTFGGSLYEGEEEVNGLEYDMVMALTAQQNIRWWHNII